MHSLAISPLLALSIAFPLDAQDVQHPHAGEGPIEYVFTLSETEVGHEKVVYSDQGWTAEGKYELGGRRVDFVATWALTGSSSFDWSVVADTSTNDATIATTWKGESIRTVIDSTPGDYHNETDFEWTHAQTPLCFENLVWAVYSEIFLRMLQGKEGEFPAVETKVVAFLPAANITFEVVLKECTPRRAAGGAVLDFRIDVDGQEMLLTTKPNGILLHLRVPVQGLEVYAKGHRADGRIVQPKTIVDSGDWREQLSAPDSDTSLALSERIPMPDGVELVADIYQPAGRGPWPVILVRTPYGRMPEGFAKGTYYATRGYVFVAQDVRGRFDSEGEWFPLRHETADGSDTLDWLAAQEWCDGNIGMIGGSYVGWVQWLAAKSGNPHLKAIVPQVSPPDPLENFPYEGGAFMLSAGWWAAVLDTQASGATAIPDLDYGAAFATLPLSNLDQALGVQHPFLDEWLAHPPTDTEYWDKVSYQPYFGDMSVAALHITGWFDGDQPGALQNFPAMRTQAATKEARNAQFLVVGPWGHGFNVATKLGDVDFGPQAVIDLDSVYLRFFDRYLKGWDNGMDEAGPVFTFTMGENRWQRSQAWPLPQTRFTKIFLGSDGQASLRADGKARSQAGGSSDPAKRRGGRMQQTPSNAEPTDTYVYDPERLPPFPDDAWDDVVGNVVTMDFSTWEDRDDSLDYTSPPMEQDVEVTGPIEVRLWVSTDGPDTDFTATILRQEVSGALRLMTSGIQRVRYRQGNAIDSPVKAGQVVEVNIDCWATSQLLHKGDRLVVQIASSAFPGYARNLNTLDPALTATRVRVAQNTVYHDAQRPSHVLLPVIPRSSEDGTLWQD